MANGMYELLMLDHVKLYFFSGCYKQLRLSLIVPGHPLK